MPYASLDLLKAALEALRQHKGPPVERYFADVLSGMESGKPCLPNLALDRGLKMLADRRPSRIVAREDYMRRAYLFGRMGHRFPEDARAVLGSLGATAYLHEIRSPDAGRSHHSHPWEWAISIVLAGSYIEEIVTADGSIVERRRETGSVAVINAGSFHRIAELGARRVWTLFIAGPRTLDRAWFFRRPDGSIVHERDYHANIEAERRAEDAWLASSHGAERIYKSTFAGVVEDLQEKLADITDVSRIDDTGDLRAAPCPGAVRGSRVRVVRPASRWAPPWRGGDLQNIVPAPLGGEGVVVYEPSDRWPGWLWSIRGDGWTGSAYEVELLESSDGEGAREAAGPAGYTFKSNARALRDGAA